VLSTARARSLVTAVDPALWVLAGIGFVAQVGISVMLPLLPLFATQLGATPVVLGLLTSAFAITNGIGQLGTGFLADRWGSRRLMTGGVGAYAAMNALIASAATAGWLLVWRSLAGFGGGAMIVAERIYVTEVTEPRRRAFANGIISAAQSAGSVAGPAVGGLVAAVTNLRAPFILVAVTSAIAFVGTLFLRRPARHATTAAIQPSESGAVPIAYAPIGVLLGANLAFNAGFGAFITTYAPLATSRMGWSTFDVGLAFSFFGAGSILLGPPLAHLADRFGRRSVAVASVLPVAGFVVAMVLGAAQAVVLAVAFVAGGGLTAFSSAWYALLADVSDERRRGRIFGVVSAISNTGIVVGATLAAQLWERVDIGVGMLSAAVAALLGGVVLLAFRAPETPTSAETEPAAEAPIIGS
jgi:MFS family permease